MNPRLPIFLSYAHADNEGERKQDRWLDRLLMMLRPLQLNNQVCAWSDKDLVPGSNWQEGINLQLTEYAKAAVLLVSPNYLGSDFVRTGELPIILARAKETGLRVIPIVLKPCLFAEAVYRYPDPDSGPNTVTLAEFQSLNSPDAPLSALREHEQDAVLLQAAQYLLSIFRNQR